MKKELQKELLKIVKFNYEEIAESFNQTRKKAIWPELENLSKNISSGVKVLDVGCGNGRLVEVLEKKNVKYLGIDQSDKMIEIAKRSRIGYEFRVGNILELGKISEVNFDYVFSIAVLHHLPSKELRIEALRQMKNKINNEGRIVLTVWNLWKQKKYRKKIIKFWALHLIGKNKLDFGDILFDWKKSDKNSKSKRYYHAFTKMELKKIIKKAGLKIEKLYSDNYNYYIVLKK